MQKLKQIIAIGGGGFSILSKPNAPRSIEHYFLEQTAKPKPRILFIPAASGESREYIINFYQAFSRFDCLPNHLSFFKPPTADLESFILDFDAIYVGGGNTKSMLALIREWKVDEYLKKAYEHGIVLGGVSAGSICWFDQGVTDSIPGALTALPCLGILSGSNCPHYDGELERRPAYHKLLLENKISAGIAIDDHVAVHFVNGKIQEIVKTNPKANAYRVSIQGNTITEEKIEL